MPEIVNCPSCQRQLRVPEDLLGQLVKCPSCSATFTAARPEVPPPVAEPPAQESVRPRDEPRPRVALEIPADDEEDFEDRRRRPPRRDLEPHRGTMILILGIISVSVCQLTGPIAWYLGQQDANEIRAGRMDPEGKSTTDAGRVLGIVGTILLVLNCLCIIPMFMLMTAVDR